MKSNQQIQSLSTAVGMGGEERDNFRTLEEIN